MQGTTGNPKATMMTHHILINNAIFAGKHFELNTEVQYMYINYVGKKPVEESDRPFSPERSQTQVKINILACNDKCRKYGTKQEKVSYI